MRGFSSYNYQKEVSRVMQPSPCTKGVAITLGTA